MRYNKLLSLFAVAVLLTSVSACGRDKKVAGPTPSPSVSASATPSPTASPVNSDDVANQLFAKGKPLEGMKDKVVAGSKNVDFGKNKEERGTAAFSKKTLKTQKELAAFLNGSSKESKAAKARVVSAIKAAKYGNDEVARALDGTGYFPLQLKEAAQILGTTYFRNGKVYEMNEWRAVQANDVFWMFLTKDKKVIVAATVRADCANPGLTRVTPQPESPPPSVDKLCPHTGDVPNINGLCPKHPEDDVLVNPDVPDQVKGPGTTPVGTDPGPAESKYDTPTGCNGPCPASPTPAASAQPSPSSTPTQPPATTPASSDPPATGKPTPPPSD